MKRLISVAILAAMAATPALAVQDAEEEVVAANSDLGQFAGSYTCQDGEHGIYLQMIVDGRTDDVAQVSGVLSFFPTVSGKTGSSGMVVGSFTVAGTISREDMSITLDPVEWLLQPEGYGAASLQGKFSETEEGLSQITGKPVVPGAPDFCSDLILTQLVLDEIVFEDEED